MVGVVGDDSVLKWLVVMVVQPYALCTYPKLLNCTLQRGYMVMIFNLIVYIFMVLEIELYC